MVYFPNTDKPVAAGRTGPAAAWTARINREDRDAPASRFTLAELGQLWGWPAPQCRELIGKLVERGHMAQTPDGLYYLVRLRRVRRDTGRPCAS